MNIVVSAGVAAEYGGRIRMAVPGAKLLVASIEDGRLAWSGDPASADVCCFTEDFWQDLDMRRLAIPALFSLERLRWFHTFSAGTDNAGFRVLIDRGTMLTNSSGASAPSIAQHVLAMMLYRSKRIGELRDQQGRREWRQIAGRDLTGLTCGIIGTGAIGGEVARLAQACRMRTIGARRTARRARYIDEMVPLTGLQRLLQESDYVVVACPLTPETERMIGERELRAMKPTATLINIARGRIIDEAMLVRALEEGWIAAACLDVFEEEPLPETSPLWAMPNVVVSPHNSGFSPLNMARAMGVFLDNLERFVQGRPLRNVVK